MSAVLRAKDMYAGYGGVPVLHGIDIEVEQGEVVALLGANGAGKTTTLLALAGVIPSEGTVLFDGAPATGPLHRRARAGLVFLPEERGVLRGLTVRENLELANVDAEQCYQISPELRALADRPAGQLSGGEQQILALTRAVASDRKVLLADELSFGLAPIVVARMLGLARQLADRGAGVLLVEQFARQALEAADRAYVLRRGEVVLSGSAAELLRDLPAVERTYFGTHSEEEIFEMTTSETAVGQSAADSTRAAKAQFVQASPDRLVALIEAQPGLTDVKLLDFQPVTDGAGASNGIALFSVAYRRDGHRVQRELVLRYMPGVQLLRQKSYAEEFATVSALSRAGLPVPEPLWLDADGSVLGCAGYVMERVDGRSPDAGMFVSGLLVEVSAEDRKSMMLAAAGFHGRLRRLAIGPNEVPHLVDRGVGDTAVQRELDWWLTEARMATALDDPKLNYVEDLRAWMVANEPTLRPATLVHGDAQIANIMFKDGDIAAVVDWELSYLGHNEADLALILFLTQAHGAQASDLEGVPTTAEYLQRYEAEAGGPAEHLEFFTLLNFVKVLSIYLMLGDKMPNLDAVWGFHVGLVDAAMESAIAALEHRS